MNSKYYTAERNIQIVIYLLKAHGIKRVIASPGATDVSLVASIQNDPCFRQAPFLKGICLRFFRFSRSDRSL